MTDSCIVNVGTTAKLTIYSKADHNTPIAGSPDEGWKKAFKAQENLGIRVDDADVSSNAVAITASTEGATNDSVLVTLTEQGDGIFVGNIKTEYSQRKYHRLAL